MIENSNVSLLSLLCLTIFVIYSSGGSITISIHYPFHLPHFYYIILRFEVHFYYFRSRVSYFSTLKTSKPRKIPKVWFLLIFSTINAFISMYMSSIRSHLDNICENLRPGSHIEIFDQLSLFSMSLWLRICSQRCLSPYFFI